MTRRRAWALLVAGGCLVVAGPLLLVATLGSSGWWWSGPQASVPRDGEAHVVRLDGPGTHVLWSDRTLAEPTCEARDARGRAVPVDPVPEDRRVVVGDAETAPASVAEVRVPGDGRSSSPATPSSRGRPSRSGSVHRSRPGSGGPTRCWRRSRPGRRSC